ncbi:MAG: CRISPR-associated protein Cas5 [Acidobacteriota bacterium]
MIGILLEIEGNWGHFKKPETNNNPLTHDFITKTALIGLIGAVLGKSRETLAKLFPQLSQDLLYGVRIHNAVKKESWAFTMRRAVDPLYKYLKQLEFLKNPHYTVAIALANERSSDLLNNFTLSVQHNEACFTPVLGLQNCPANLRLISIGTFKKGSGDFVTMSFITAKHKISTTKEFRLGIDNIPIYQNEDFWNPPDKYRRVIYPTEGREISASGEYYEFSDKSLWVLI